MGLDICHAKPSPKTIDTLEYFTLDEFIDKPAFIDRHAHLICDIEADDNKKVQVLYFIDIATQRKQMNNNFIREFENNKIYFDLKSVIHARRFLQARLEENQEELIKSFNSDFIDNFVEGESIFYASW